MPGRRVVAYGIIATAVLVSAIAGQLIPSSYSWRGYEPWVESILLLGMIGALAVVDSPRPRLRAVGVTVAAAVFVGVWLLHAVGLSYLGLSFFVGPVLTAGAASAWILVRRERGLAFSAVPLAVLLGVISTRGVEVQMNSNDGWLAPLFAVVPVALTAWLAWGIERMNRPPASVIQAKWPQMPMQGMPPGSYPYQSYPQGPAPYPATMRRQNPLAITALVLSLLMLSLPAVVLGHVGRGQIRNTGDQGWQMATAGVIIGYLGMLVYVVATVIFIAAS